MSVDAILIKDAENFSTLEYSLHHFRLEQLEGIQVEADFKANIIEYSYGSI
jgi:hypothetical protein